MSVGFRAVQWNPAKLVYDAVLLTLAPDEPPPGP